MLIYASFRGNVTRCAALGFVVLFSLAAVGNLNAQATGSISGIVSDTSGAVMADAAVQVKNTGTGVTQAVNSDSQGRYRIAELAIGDYELQATKMGFQTVIRRGV